MSMNKKDFFDDDFEVIYEGDLPDLPEDDNDDYEDVLQKLADRIKNMKPLIIAGNTWKEAS